MRYRIVFCDVDGTLLSSDHRVLPQTLAAIQSLRRQGVPFVIISARSPSGIYPIQDTYGFQTPIIAYNGALMLDEHRNTLYSNGLSLQAARQVIDFLEGNQMDCSWNVYAGDSWIVKNKRDPRIIREERIVRTSAVEGTLDLLPGDAAIGKVLCMCNPSRLPAIEERLRGAFPSLSIVRSSDILLEIMQNGVSKSSAVRFACGLWSIPLEAAIAFGDHYNDVEMLQSVGTPFLMGNAPDEIKKRFHAVTDSNDEDGIYHALASIGMVPPC